MKTACCLFRCPILLGCLMVILLPLMIAGCATTGIGLGDINIVSTSEEVEMGRDLSQEVEKQFEVYGDAEVAAYVQSVGDRIVRVSGRSDIEYHFAVIKKDELNAFALPGGYIYIYTGLMKELDDESQLAGVLAHEIGHVTARHATERLTRMYGYQIVIGWILGKDPNAWAKLVSDIFATTGFLAYSRENEFESDRLGIRYAYAAGYDPAGMLELLGKLKGTSARETGKLEALLSTHPPTGERMSRVEAMTAELPASGARMRNKAEYGRMKTRLP